MVLLRKKHRNSASKDKKYYGNAPYPELPRLQAQLGFSSIGYFREHILAFVSVEEHMKIEKSSTQLFLYCHKANRWKQTTRKVCSQTYNGMLLQEVEV